MLVHSRATIPGPEGDRLIRTGRSAGVPARRLRRFDGGLPEPSAHFLTVELTDEQRAAVGFIATAARTPDELAARFGDTWVATLNALERGGYVSRRVTQYFTRLDIRAANPRVVTYEVTARGERALRGL
jgi:hypothetical protein